MSLENRVTRLEYVQALNTVRKFKSQKGHNLQAKKCNHEWIMVMNGGGTCNEGMEECERCKKSKK